MGIPVLYQGSLYAPVPFVPIPPDVGPTPPDPIGDALRAAVTQYWKLDEVSGTRVNSKVGGVDLSSVNNAGSTTGKLYSLASLFDTIGQALYHDDAMALQLVMGSFTLACWFFVDSTILGNPGKSIQGALMNKGGDGQGDEFGLQIVDTFTDVNNLQCMLFVPGGDQSYPSVFSTEPGKGYFDTDVWHFVVAKYDSTSNKISIRLNNSPLNYTNVVSGSLPTADNFRIGNSGYGEVMFGRIGPAMIFKGYVTSDDEDIYLYNSGAGRALFP